MSANITQYDQDFAHAMSLKLLTSQKAVDDDELQLTEEIGALRARSINKTIEQHQGLTLKQAYQMMNELGFKKHL